MFRSNAFIALLIATASTGATFAVPHTGGSSNSPTKSPSADRAPHDFDPHFHELMKRDVGIPGHTACFAAAQPIANLQSVSPQQPRSAGSNADAFSAQCMDRINAIRIKFGRQPFSYSAKQASQAQSWANNPTWAHNRAGQNMYSGNDFDCAAAVDSWAAEIAGLRDGDLIDNVWQTLGHATQLLDTNTKTVGCATGVKTVCNFDPPGNMLGTKFYFNPNRC